MTHHFPPLIRALTQPACYPHPVAVVEVIETHISWVLLTGAFAYKIKKPVNLGFLDFSSLEQRRFDCEEELRLNRRLAPALYLEVTPIGGTITQPQVGQREAILEYAVRMRQFPATCRFDEMLARNALRAAHMTALAEYLARFHAQAPLAPPGSPWGEPSWLRQPVDENFAELATCPPDVAGRQTLETLRQWCAAAFIHLAPHFARRKTGGRIREGHGDLHLGNLAWLDGAPLAFDCIEFNPDLRWGDVMSDLAFILMDLEYRGQPALAAQLLDAYLAHSGDYGGLAVLRYYLVYRALVRAKVDAIRSHQPRLVSGERQALNQACQNLLELAARLVRPSPPLLLITRGLPGSGKTHLTQGLLAALPAIRLRSDVERKRLAGLAPTESSGSPPGAGLYAATITEQTYRRLEQLAEGLLAAGWPVIVDAAFLHAARRAAFLQLGLRVGAPCVILDVQTAPAVLRERVRARTRAGQDASEADAAVLEHLLPHHGPLAATEQPHALVVDGAQPPGADALAAAVRTHATAQWAALVSGHRDLG